MSNRFVHLNKGWKRAIVRFAQWPLVLCMGNTIRGGIFKGISIPVNTFGSAVLPKLLGTYESEMAIDLDACFKDERHDLFVDVGCAGGYYIAIALQCNSNIKVVGVDSNPRAIEECNKSFKKYEDRSIFVNKMADARDVEAMLTNHNNSIVMIDIEGAEKKFFQDVNVDCWHATTIVIEIHRFLKVDEMEISAIYKDSHDSKIINFENYNLKSVNFIGYCLELFAKHELRHPNTCYLLLTPKVLSA